MISEQEFLTALKIVNDYQQQINTLLKSTKPNVLPSLKRDDIIRFTKVSDLTKQILIGVDYRVMHHYIRVANPQSFRNHLMENYPEYKKGLTWKDEEDLKLMVIAKDNIPFQEVITVNIGRGKQRKIISNGQYDYEVTNKKVTL